MITSCWKCFHGMCWPQEHLAEARFWMSRLLTSCFLTAPLIPKSLGRSSFCSFLIACFLAVSLLHVSYYLVSERICSSFVPGWVFSLLGERWPCQSLPQLTLWAKTRRATVTADLLWSSGANSSLLALKIKVCVFKSGLVSNMAFALCRHQSPNESQPLGLRVRRCPRRRRRTQNRRPRRKRRWPRRWKRARRRKLLLSRKQSWSVRQQLCLVPVAWSVRFKRITSPVFFSRLELVEPSQYFFPKVRPRPPRRQSPKNQRWSFRTRVGTRQTTTGVSRSQVASSSWQFLAFIAGISWHQTGSFHGCFVGRCFF